jgi:hypothetical protein
METPIENPCREEDQLNGKDAAGMDANGMDANGMDANGMDANGMDAALSAGLIEGQIESN